MYGVGEEGTKSRSNKIRLHKKLKLKQEASRGASMKERKSKQKRNTQKREGTRNCVFNDRTKFRLGRAWGETPKQLR